MLVSQALVSQQHGTSFLGLNFVGGGDMAVLQLHDNFLSIFGARAEAGVLGSNVQGTGERQLHDKSRNVSSIQAFS